MSIRILKAGLFDTVQDAGRYGYQHLGVNPGGVMDNVATAIVNILVGNKMNNAVIEIHFPAATFYFESTTMIAISGGDFQAQINETNIPLNTAILVEAGAVLSFKKYRAGARVYLAIHGRFLLNEWLRSYSTNIKAKAGGYVGRRLQKDDVLQIADQTLSFNKMPFASFIVTPVRATYHSLYNSNDHTNCIKGKDFENLTEQGRNAFLQTAFTISRQSDRMGYKLQGENIEHIKQTESISAAVTKGSIQLLPEGQLIILMADHQTTGGYPVVAHVCSADIPLLAQMQPGTTIKFSFTDIAQAQDNFIKQHEYLQQLQAECNLQLKQFFS